MELKYKWQNLTDNTIQVDIFTEIDSYWGYSLASLTNQLTQANGAPLLVRLNSPGGSVVEGLAIANLLNGYSGGVTVQVVGYAASIASVIVAKAKRAVMAKDSFLMIHEPYVGVMGATAEQLGNLADTAQMFEDTIVNTYLDSMDKRKKKKEDSETIIRNAMKAETWYTADQALELGLIDEVVDSVPTLDNVASQPYSGGFWNSMKDYKNMPIELKNKFTNINQEDKMSTNKTTLWDQVKNLLSGADAVADAPEVEVKNDAVVEPMTAEQMIEHLSANGYNVTPLEEAITPEAIAEEIKNQVAAQVATIKAQLKADAAKGAFTVGQAQAKVEDKKVEASVWDGLANIVKNKQPR